LKLFVKKSLSLVISILFIALAFHNADIRKVISILGTINISFILPVLGFYYFAFVLRVYRWKVILNGADIEVKALFKPLFKGYFFNCILPARAGDIYRSYLLGKKEKISKLKVFASVIFERIIDGLTLVLILLAFICYKTPNPILIKIAFLTGLSFFGCFILLLFYAKKRDFLSKLVPFKQKLCTGKFSNITYFLDNFSEGLDIFNSLYSIVKTFIITFVIWMIESVVILLIMKSLGITVSIFSSLFVLSVVALSIVIPSGPSGLGPYQWGYILGLSILGIGKETALAASFLNQFLLLIVVSAGMLFYTRGDKTKLNEAIKHSTS